MQKKQIKFAIFSALFLFPLFVNAASAQDNQYTWPGFEPEDCDIIEAPPTIYDGYDSETNTSGARSTKSCDNNDNNKCCSTFTLNNGEKKSFCISYNQNSNNEDDKFTGGLEKIFSEYCQNQNTQMIKCVQKEYLRMLDEQDQDAPKGKSADGDYGPYTKSKLDEELKAMCHKNVYYSDLWVKYGHNAGALDLVLKKQDKPTISVIEKNSSGIEQTHTVNKDRYDALLAGKTVEVKVANAKIFNCLFTQTSFPNAPAGYPEQCQLVFETSSDCFEKDKQNPKKYLIHGAARNVFKEVLGGDARPKYLIGTGKRGDADTEMTGEIRDITYWIQVFINKGTIYVSLFAVLFIAYSGFIMVFSNAEDDRITKAKEGIKWAVIGLLLLMFSYVIIKTVISLTFTEKTTSIHYEIKKV